jgi:cytidine deaminase
MSDDELIQLARATVSPRRLSPSVEVGGVASALLTDTGASYVGVCIDTGSSMGFCAEHAAIGTMVSAGESGRIVKIVAVLWDDRIIPPCGRCREFILQMHPENPSTQVILSDGRTAAIDELLPEREGP